MIYVGIRSTGNKFLLFPEKEIDTLEREGMVVLLNVPSSPSQPTNNDDNRTLLLHSLRTKIKPSRTIMPPQKRKMDDAEVGMGGDRPAKHLEPAQLLSRVRGVVEQW